MSETKSKPLGSEDKSAAKFVIEMLKGEPTYGINFDRIQWDSKNECYVIVEYLLCAEKQFSRGITPYTSHPNKYFDKNSQKFISLWEITEKLDGILLLVNYSKKETEYEDQVKVMRVDDINPEADEPVKTEDRKFDREGFSKWFRKLNKRGKKKQN